MNVFHTPTKILFGAKSIENIGAEIKASGIKKVLCLFGSGSVKTNGVYDRTVKSLTDNGISHEELWGVQPNPVIGKVREGVTICKDKSKGIEAVLAVGGGSCIDSAKAICAGAVVDGDAWGFYDRTIAPPPKILPLFTVLTLSATASEYNTGAVLSNPETKQKLAAFFEPPVASALDPSVQLSLPYRQVVCGAVDAMSHLMEQYFSPPNKNITTRQINLALQRSIILAMERVKKDLKDVEARGEFVWAVSLGLNGIAGFMLGADWNVHYIEHAISAFDDKVAHAEGLAVVSLAYYPWLFKKGICNDQFQEWAELVFGTKDVNEALKKLKELFAFWEAPLCLEDLKLKEENITEIAKIEQTHQDKGSVSALYQLSEADVVEILKLSLKK